MTPSLHNSEIARSGSPSSRCLSDRPAGGSLLPALRPVTQSTFDQQKTTHRGLGARHNRAGAARCGASFPAHRQGLAHVGMAGNQRSFPLMGTDDCLLTDLPLKLGRASARPLFAHSGIEAGTSHLVANLIQSRHQGRFQRFAKGQPRHFRKSFREPVASTATKPREAMNAVPKFQASGSSHDR